MRGEHSVAGRKAPSVEPLLRPDPQVVVRGVSYAFPGTGDLFCGLDADLHAGEVVAVVGPSGSGKSTFLQLLAGWIAATGGTVERHSVSRVGWVFQNPHGVARRTVLDHVVLPLVAAGATRSTAEPAARAVLEQLGLGAVADRDFRHLSGGESQRLMLARAMARAPDLLLVDEPTAQLDSRTASAVSAALARVADARRIVVVATHDPQTRDACTRVLDLGSIT